MKPRNKREREVAQLSSMLPPLTIQEEWAKGHVFSHQAFKCKDELWCSDCGQTWVNAGASELSVILGIDNKVQCPCCHQNLKVVVSRKQKNDEVNYMTIATISGGYQVLRHVYCYRFTRKKDSYLCYFFEEVVQEWISEDGKRTIMAKPMNMGSTGWLYSEPLSIKNEYGTSYYFGDGYSLWGEIYPEIRLLPILKKRGLRNSFHNVAPSKLIRALLTGGNDCELCVKTKQYNMLQYLIKSGSRHITHKPSFNICNRNKYKIKDASMWVDYINLLVYFHKDIRNAHYICPKNLKEEHDVLMNKKDRIEAELRRQRDRERVVRNALSKKESILEFYKEKMKFFGIEIKGDGITIHPIESVTQFYQEAKAMKHCVFSNGYYKRKDCLILSARDNEGKRLETIELNLKTFDIVQSRAVCNGVSEHHDRIIQLVKKNINLIRQRIA